MATPRSIYVDAVEAQAVHDALYGKSNALQHQLNVPSTRFTDVYLAYQNPGPRGSDHALQQQHAKLFERESFVLRAGKNGITTDTRVFPPKSKNILMDVNDLFRNGVGFFRAAMTVMGDKDKKECNRAFESFCKVMDKYRNDYDLETDEKAKMAILAKANRKLAEFNGALASEVVAKETCQDLKQAYKAICTVRGYQFKLSYPERQCTILEQATTEATAATRTLYFSTPTTFSPKPNDTTSPWHDYQNQEWYKNLKKRAGGGDWFDRFFRDNNPLLQTLSTVPMERATPNPANANDTTTAVFDASGQLLQTLNTSRVGITEPYEAAAKDRAVLTKFNHQQLMNEDRLRALVAAHCERWSCLYGTDEINPIVIPYLHQTLITDTVRLSGDSMKSSTMLDNKALANQALREDLAGKCIYVNKTDPSDVRIFEKGSKLADEFLRSPTFNNYREVRFEVLEVNNCINAHEKRSRVRDNDISDSRKLVQHAAMHLERMNDKLDDTGKAALSTVLKFLKSADHSFFNPYKSRGPEVKSAIETISKQLKDLKEPPGLGRNLDVAMRAAVELKCTVHETWFGAARRRASNALLKVPVLGRIAKWLFVDSVALVVKAASLLVPPAGWVGVAKWARHQGTRRKALYKSGYEGLLAGQLGAIESGCMSNEDRGGEKSAFERAMLTQYNTTGEIIGYNDEPAKKRQFLATFGNNTQDEHNTAKITTDSAIIKSGEVRNPLLQSGLLSEEETDEELELSEKLDATRKGKFAVVTVEQFVQKVAAEVPAVVAPTVRGENTATLDQQLAARVGVRAVDIARADLTVTETAVATVAADEAAHQVAGAAPKKADDTLGEGDESDDHDSTRHNLN